MTNKAPYVKTTNSQLYIPNIFFKSGVEIAVACVISAEIIYRSKMYIGVLRNDILTREICVS
jgi:hypothetical protein